jgi:hypothetical protein
MSINLKCEDSMAMLMTTLKRLSTYILFDSNVSKWAVSTLTHFSNPFQVNMFMYGQQLRYLLLLIYSLPYILYMFSPAHVCDQLHRVWGWGERGGL